MHLHDLFISIIKHNIKFGVFFAAVRPANNTQCLISINTWFEPKWTCLISIIECYMKLIVLNSPIRGAWRIRVSLSGYKCVLEDSALGLWLTGAQTSQRRQRLNPRLWLVGFTVAPPPSEVCHTAKQQCCRMSERQQYGLKGDRRQS